MTYEVTSVGASWNDLGARDGLGLSPRWLSWASPGHQLESRISRHTLPCLEMNHVRALGCRSCLRRRLMVSGHLALELRAHTPTGADSGRAMQKSGTKELLLQARQRKTEALEASPIKVRDPQTPEAKGLDRYHRAELQHRAPNFCGPRNCAFLRVLRVLPCQD
jgi:hypothetical protein